MTEKKPELLVYRGFMDSKSLPKLIDTIHKKGNKVTVYTKDNARMESFDSQLWSYEQLSFTPHLTEKDEHLAETPIILVTQPVNHNESNILVLLDYEMAKFSCAFDKIVMMVDKTSEVDVRKVNKLVEEFQSSGINITQYEQTQAGAQWQKIA